MPGITLPNDRWFLLSSPHDMSIATRTGDDGTTALMYKRRVPKTHPRVEACGAIDELNAAIGVARAQAANEWLQSELLPMQKQLITIMGELATIPDDREHYVKDGYEIVTSELTAKLDGLVQHLEAQNISFHGWATPGATLLSAALDTARVTCRRAERRVCAVRENGDVLNPEILIYLNRLSDVLWLMARWAETKPAAASARE